MKLSIKIKMARILVVKGGRFSRYPSRLVIFRGLCHNKKIRISSDYGFLTSIMSDFAITTPRVAATAGFTISASSCIRHG